MIVDNAFFHMMNKKKTMTDGKTFVIAFFSIWGCPVWRLLFVFLIL